MSGRMPVVRLKQHKSIEAHRDRHRMFPFRAIERVLVEDVVLKGFVGGIADRLQASFVHGNAIGLSPLVPEKLGPALAVLWSAQVQNAGPIACPPPARDEANSFASDVNVPVAARVTLGPRP